MLDLSRYSLKMIEYFFIRDPYKINLHKNVSFVECNKTSNTIFFIYLIFSTLHHHIYCISINLIKNKVYENSFLIMNMKES